MIRDVSQRYRDAVYSQHNPNSCTTTYYRLTLVHSELKVLELLRLELIARLVPPNRQSPSVRITFGVWSAGPALIMDEKDT